MGATTTDQTTYAGEQTTETLHLDAMAFAGTAALVSAAVMLVLGVFGAIGVYEGAVEMMEQWHLFFEPTAVGTLAGMVEAAVVAFVVSYPFAWIYNAFAR